MQAQRGNLALLTDLYEFSMAQAYYQGQMFAPATFFKAESRQRY